MTRHCMIDLETLGNTSHAAIIQIGWCMFDDDKLIMSAQRVVDVADAVKHGVVCASTLKWWFQQSDQARMSVIKGQPDDTLAFALSALTMDIDDYQPEHFWAHATFDFPILNNAFEACNMVNPISFRKCRDIRTLDMLAHADTIEDWPVREGVHHDAKDDAVHQSKCVQLMLKKVGWK